MLPSSCFLKFYLFYPTQTVLLFLPAFDLNLIFMFLKNCQHLQYGLYQTPSLTPPTFNLVYSKPLSTAGYIMGQHGKGLTSCTTMCSLTPASLLLVSPATRLVLTSQRTRIMTVSGLPIVTGLAHFLVRYRFRKQDALVQQLVFNYTRCFSCVLLAQTFHLLCVSVLHI